jgi:hypothetical protein
MNYKWGKGKELWIMSYELGEEHGIHRKAQKKNGKWRMDMSYELKNVIRYPVSVTRLIPYP